MLKFLKNNQFLIILCICSFSYSFSQVEEQKKDSTAVIYKRIEDYSKKTKPSKLLHWLIFKSKDKPKNEKIASKSQNYSPFEGKIIRDIIVKSHDPFGVSLTDSTETANSWLEKTGNKLHVRSKDFAIKNYIIFKKNSLLDSLLIKESERLIRSQRFIRSVEITVKHPDKSTDSVDVYIKTIDAWSLVPGVSTSNTRMNLKLTEYNYLGFGHRLNLGLENRFDDGKTAPSFLYRMPNFKNSYISSTLAHTSRLDDSYSNWFNIVRPFFSPYTKWAAGMYFDQQFKREFLPNVNQEFISQNFKYQSQDFWAGYSFHLFKGKSERERSANLISSFRFLNKDYREKPGLEFDDIQFFSNETFYLGSIGISSRQFIEERYLFRDGIIENVPIGDVYAFTFGNQYKNKQNRFYLGAKIAHGNYYNWGYFSANFEFGTFLKKSKTEQAAYSFSINYFTNLIPLGSKWKMRQFIKPEVLIGKNRLNSIGDRLTIDEANGFRSFYGNEEERKSSIGIPGFNSNLMGTSKYVLSLQTQFYSPWKILSFKFNPYLNLNLAMIEDEKVRYINNKLYSSFSVGLIIRNDYLVFNSFQLSLSFYPSIPGQGNNIFKTNAIKNDDFRLQGFELRKPSPIWYN